MERFILLIVGIIVGGVIVSAFLRKKNSGKLLVEGLSLYGFDETISRLQQAVDAKGWKTPHVHDLQATMKKFDLDVLKVTVMEICKPDYAYRVLTENDERIASVLMPCRISVYEKNDGKVYVSRLLNSGIGSSYGGIIESAMGMADNDNEEIILAVTK